VSSSRVGTALLRSGVEDPAQAGGDLVKRGLLLALALRQQAVAGGVHRPHRAGIPALSLEDALGDRHLETSLLRDRDERQAAALDRALEVGPDGLPLRQRNALLLTAGGGRSGPGRVAGASSRSCAASGAAATVLM
jgi:hypothetical protein